MNDNAFSERSAIMAAEILQRFYEENEILESCILHLLNPSPNTDKIVLDKIKSIYDKETSKSKHCNHQ